MIKFNGYLIHYDDTLSHHGVLGMKWGKWNSETAARYAGKSSKVGKATSEGAQRASSAASRIERVKRSKRSDEAKKLSDDELRKRINRMNLEKQYDQLKAEELEAGKMSASEVLAVVGDVAATAAAVATVVSIFAKFGK